jgi:transaldolase/glucose-6-phosphate isomerase
MATPTTVPATRQLLALGQSVWLDSISRQLLDSGGLERMVRDGWVTGVTSNPSIFEKAVAGSTDYDAQIAGLARDRSVTRYDAFVALAADDIRWAADVLRPVYDQAGTRDGYVSLEVPTGIEHDVAATVAEAKRLFALVGRPNVMIKVPGTPAGVTAARELIAAGVNVNITLLFAVSAYEATAEAFIAGLEDRLAAGRPISSVASVASFFVSRLDTAVDALLPADSPLRGKAAVANARVAYERFEQIFSGARWERLAAAGAQVQRPLWASTGTKNPAYSDVLYVEELVAPNTVNTMPEATLKAMLDHGRVAEAIGAGLARSKRNLEGLAAGGVDLDGVTAKLLVDGLASFERDFLKLLDRIDSALAVERVGRPRAALRGLASAVESRLAALQTGEVVKRTWAGDHKVWKPEPKEIADRLGWLTVADDMRSKVPELRAFAQEVAAAGYRDVVLMGMGGSSLAPEVMRATFGLAAGGIELHVLDTTDPEQIAGVEESVEMARTLLVVASKSGGTIETLSQLAYFWEKLPDGDHYVAITDSGTSLEALARQRRFRRVFVNPTEIGGRYSALSYFGLVPAALIGVDLDRLLSRAHEAMAACGPSTPTAENPGAWLGAVMAEAALAGRDKLTLVLPPELSTLGCWIEQLVAESTGKEGRGILPVEGEDLGGPNVYGNDRLFVAIGDDPRLAALERAGHPVVRLSYSDPYQLGDEFFRWEFATAVASSILAVNPFDQPNVQEAKDATARILGGAAVDSAAAPLDDVLGSVKAGDYIAITAYMPRNTETIAELSGIRRRLRDRYRVATTVGFGPRFLHSTGQLHKGGSNNGVFIQIVEGEERDLPIPGKAYTFGKLKAAQADGDLASLKAHGRPVSRVTTAQLRAFLGM